MPEICRFFGIIIYIHYGDHNPPHFHAVYGEYEASIDIEALTVISGYLPPRALGLVIEWGSQRQAEIRNDWLKAVNHQRLDRVEPLK